MDGCHANGLDYVEVRQGETGFPGLIHCILRCEKAFLTSRTTLLWRDGLTRNSFTYRVVPNTRRNQAKTSPNQSASTVTAITSTTIPIFLFAHILSSFLPNDQPLDGLLSPLPLHYPHFLALFPPFPIYGSCHLEVLGGTLAGKASSVLGGDPFESGSVRILRAQLLPPRAELPLNITKVCGLALCLRKGHTVDKDLQSSCQRFGHHRSIVCERTRPLLPFTTVEK